MLILIYWKLLDKVINKYWNDKIKYALSKKIICNYKGVIWDQTLIYGEGLTWNFEGVEAKRLKD